MQTVLFWKDTQGRLRDQIWTKARTKKWFVKKQSIQSFPLIWKLNSKRLSPFKTKPNATLLLFRKKLTCSHPNSPQLMMYDHIKEIRKLNINFMNIFGNVWNYLCNVMASKLSQNELSEQNGAGQGTFHGHW